MSVLSVHKTDFAEEVLTSNLPVLVDFWATWCGPCRMLSPIVDEVAAAQEGKVKVVKINIDEEPELAQQYGVMSIPTLLVFKNGRAVSRSVGVKPRSAVEQLLK